MSAKPRIFISAVSKELDSARQLIANTLISIGYEPVWQDIFGTEQGDVKEMLRRKIDPCQGLIQLVGQRFGIGPTNPETDRYAVSYTQYELQYAREQKLKAWPIILGEQYPSDAPNDESKACRKNQKRYRESLAPKPGSSKPPVPIYQRAANPAELENLILKLRDDLAVLRGEDKKRQRRITAILACIAIGVLLILGIGLGVKRNSEANTTQLNLLTEYVRRSMAEAAAGQRGDEAIREQALLSQLEKEHRLPAGTLTNQLPAFARKLALDGTATKYERAQGAYAARDFVEAERLAVEAAAESKKSLPIDKSKIIRELELAGWSANQRRDDQKALAHFTDASALTDKTREPREWARVHHALAHALNNRGESAQAESLLRPVILICTEKYGPENSATMISRNTLATVLHSRGQYTNAETEHRAVLKILERVAGPEHYFTLASRGNLALVLNAQGKSAEAEKECRGLLKIQERLLGPEDPTTLNTRNTLALTLIAQGEPAEGEKIFRAVLKVQERVLGPEHPDTLTSRNNLVSALGSQEKFADAEAELRILIGLRTRILGAEHPDTLNCRMNLGNALNGQQNQEKNAEAEAEYRAVLKIQQRVQGPEHPNTLTCWLNLTALLDAQRKHVEAEVEYRALLEVQKRILGEDHPNTLASLYNLALCLRDQQHRRTEARDFARQAMEGSRRVLGALHPHTKESEQLYRQLMISQ